MKHTLSMFLLMYACQTPSFSVRELTVTHELTEVATCEDARALIRERAAAEANRSIDRHVQAELNARASNRLYNPLGGTGCQGAARKAGRRARKTPRR